MRELPIVKYLLDWFWLSLSACGKSILPLPDGPKCPQIPLCFRVAAVYGDGNLAFLWCLTATYGEEETL